MKLTVSNRLALLSILPAEGDITTIRIIGDLRKQLSFSEEEHAALGVRVDEGNIHWNPDAETEMEFNMGKKAKEIIAKALEGLNASNSLREAHLELWEMFMEDEGDE